MRQPTQPIIEDASGVVRFHRNAITSELKRFCPISELYQDADDPICSSIGCYVDRGWHSLRLRRMWICSECREGYFNKADAEGHECGIY